MGPAMAETVGRLGLPGVTTDADYQLNIEDAAHLAGFDRVVFVDASIDAVAPFAFREIRPGADIAFTSHSVSPESVLALCEDHFGGTPEAWVLAVRGYAFEFSEGITPRARDNFDQALDFLQGVLQGWKEGNMDSSVKTVLTIDDDQDIRDALRIVLEAEGYAVEEAATGEEGLEVAKQSKPSAIVVDLMMETVDAGSVVAKSLREWGYGGPVYLLSSAGDTVRYNIDARDLGLSGIFQKPIDPKTLVATLKAKLGD